MDTPGGDRARLCEQQCSVIVRGMTNTAAHSLPADAFPFTVEAIDLAGEVVWSQVVSGPGALEVPPLAAQYGPVSIRIAYADGNVVHAPPEGS